MGKLADKKKKIEQDKQRTTSTNGRRQAENRGYTGGTKPAQSSSGSASSSGSKPASSVSAAPQKTTASASSGQGLKLPTSTEKLRTTNPTQIILEAAARAKADELEREKRYYSGVNMAPPTNGRGFSTTPKQMTGLNGMTALESLQAAAFMKNEKNQSASELRRTASGMDDNSAGRQKLLDTAGFIRNLSPYDQKLPDAQRNAIVVQKNQWNAAQDYIDYLQKLREEFVADGYDPSGIDSAIAQTKAAQRRIHDTADLARAHSGYTGGSDGSQFHKWNLSPEYTNVSSDNANWAPTARAAAGNDTFDIEEYKGAGADRETWIDPTWRLKEEMARNEATAEQLRKMGYGFHADNIMKDVAEVAAQQANPDSGDQRAQNLMLSAVNRVRGSLMSFGALASQAAKNAAANNDRLGPVYNYTIKMRRAEDALRKAEHQGDEEGIKKYEAEIEKYKTLIYGGQKYIPGTDGELTESYKNRAIADTPGVSERGHELLEESRHQMTLAKRGLGGWGQFAMETAGVGLENIPTMAMFALAPPAGAAYMGATVLGEKGDEFSRNEFGAVEYSAQEALLKAFPYAVVETATEAAGDSAILSFINRRGSLGLGGVVARAALTEGAEEGAAGILDYGLDALYGNPAVRGYSFERIMRDILKQSAQGAIIGGIMGAGGAVIAGRIGSSEEQIDPEWYNKVDTSPLGSYSERFGRNRWMPGTSDYFEVRQFIQDEVDRRNAEALGSDYMNETPVRYDPRTWGQDMNILVDMYREGGITDKEWREIAFDDDLVSVLEDTAERKMESGSRVEWVKKTIDELANIQAEYNGGRTIERSEPYGSLSRGISDENANAASEILRNETTGERGGIARSGAADALIRAAGGDVKANVYDVEKRAAELAEKGGTEKGADIVSMVDRAGKPASVRMEEENEVSEPVSILDMAKKSKEPAYVRLDEEDTGSETVDIRSMVQPAKTAEPVVDGDITDYEYTDDDVPAENNDSRTAEDMAENTYEGMSDEEIADTLNSIYQEQIKAGDAAVDETENAADIIRNALPEMDEATEREVITGVIDAIESISQKDGVPWTKTDIEKFAKRAYDDIVRSKEEETKESPAVSEQSDESSDGSKRSSLESAIRAAHEGITDEQISEVMGYVSDDMLNSKSTDDIVKMLEPGIKGVMEAGREGTEAEAELDKRTINEKLSDPKYNPLEDETLKGSYLLRAVSEYFGSLSDPMRNVMIDMYERDNDAPMERTDVIDYYRQFVSIVGAYNDLTLAKERGRGDDVTAGAVWEKVFSNNYDNPLFNEKDVRKILREIEKISKEEKEEEQEERKPLESEFLRYMDDDSPDMFLKDENGYLPVVPHPTDEDVTTQDNVIGYSEIIRKGFKYRDYDSIMVTKTDKDAVMTMLRSVPELRAEFGTNWSDIKETLAISEELKKEFTPFIECEWQDDLEDGSSTYYVRALVYAPVNENESDKKIRTGEGLYESGRKKPPKVKNTEYTEAKAETEEQESAPKAEKPGPFLDRYGILAPQFVRRHFNSVGTGIKNGVYETYQELLFIYDEMLSEGIVKKETVRKRLEDVAKRIEKIQKDEINDPRMQAIHGFLRDRGLRLTESDIRSTADLDKIKAEYRDSKRLKITEADYKRDSSGNKVYYTGGDFNKKGHRTPNVDVYWEDLIREFNDIGIVRYYEEEVENKREDIIPAIIAICDAVWSAKDNFVSADTIIDSLVEDYISSYEYIEKFGDRYGYRDDDELPFDKVSETSEKPEKQKKQTQKPKKAEKQDGPGLVMDDYVRANVSRAEQKRLDESAKALGVTIRFVDEVNGGASNAQYDNGVVLIEKNNPNPTLFLYGHEITHHLEDTAPDAHKRLKKYLKNQGDFRKRLADMKELYRSKGYQVTDEYLENEVIADMVGELIENEDILKRFIKANRKNQNFLQKIFAAFRSLLAKLGGTGRSAKVAKACRLIEDAIDASIEKEFKKRGGVRNSVKFDYVGGQLSLFGNEEEYSGDMPLMACRATKIENLIRALDDGCFVSPSIAVEPATYENVIKNKYNTSYVFFGRQVVDPEETPKNVIFQRDAWTPKTPSERVLRKAGIEYSAEAALDYMRERGFEQKGITRYKPYGKAIEDGIPTFKTIEEARDSARYAFSDYSGIFQRESYTNYEALADISLMSLARTISYELSSVKYPTDEEISERANEIRDQLEAEYESGFTDIRFVDDEGNYHQPTYYELKEMAKSYFIEEIEFQMSEIQRDVISTIRAMAFANPDASVVKSVFESKGWPTDDRTMRIWDSYIEGSKKQKTKYYEAKPDLLVPVYKATAVILNADRNTFTFTAKTEDAYMKALNEVKERFEALGIPVYVYTDAISEIEAAKKAISDPGTRFSLKKAAQVARNKVIPGEGKYTLSDARAWFDALNSDEENVALADRVFDVLGKIEKDTGKQFSVYVAKTRRMLPGYRYAAGVSAGSNVALNTLFFSRPILAFAEIVGGDRGSDTILHELIHSATWYALEMVEFEDYRVSPEIQAFYDEVSEIYSIVKKNKMLFNPMFSYGLTNKYEMLAQLSAEQFRNVLRTISTEKGNALQRIINAIAGFFGIRTKAVENNMLDRLYAALDRIIENYDAELFAAFESEYFEDGGSKLMLNSDFVDSLNQAGETGVRNSLKSDVNSQNEDSSEGEEEEWPTNGKPMDTIPPRFDEVYHNYVSPMERHGIKDGDYVSASTITEIFKELTDDEYQINLYNNVFSALDKIGAMPTFRFYSELPDKVIGRYHYHFHRVEYSAAYYGERRFKSGLNAKLHEEKIANAILHELIHALTFHVINRLDSSKVSDETLEILGKISQEIRVAYDELVSDENFKDIYLYGRKNVDEFLAELSNPRFREILSNISHKRFGYDHLAFKRDLEIEAARNKTVDDVIHKTPILRDFLNGNEKATEIVRKILIFLAKTFEAFVNLNYNFISGKAVYLTEDYDAALFREKHAIGETPYYSGIQEEDNLLSFLEAAIGAIAQNTNESIYVKYMETQEPSKSGARNSLKTSQFKQWGVTDSEVTRNPDNTQTGKTITEIVDWVQTQIGVQVTTGQMRGMPKTVRGYYRNSDQAIRTRINNNLPTITHELGHWLDDMTSRKTGGKIGDFSNSLSEEARKELIENTDVVARYQNEGERVQVSEGFAEFIREFLKSKASAQAKFPTVYKELYNSVDARQMQQLDYLADMVNDYMTSPADLSNAIRRRNDRVDTRTRKQKTEERAHQIYQTWVDTNHAIEILTRETGDRSPYIAATNAAYAAHRAGAIITRNMYSLDGTTLVGPSLKHALEGAGLNMKDEKKAKEEYDAFGTYLVAKHGPERILEGAERSGKGRVIADDRMNDIAFLDKTAAELEEKYPHFKQAAEALYQFQKDFLYEYAVGSGIISKKTADEWQDRWDFYVPFQRYMADGKGTDSSASRGFANQVAGIYKFKGSGRDIIHPVDSVIGFVTRMTTVAVMNDVMSQLTDSVVRYGLEARWMERVQTPEDVVKVSTESFKKKVLKFIDDQMDFEEWEEDDVQEFKDGLMALDDEIAKYMQGKPHGNVVSVYKNGKAEFWKVNDKMLLESLTSMQPKTMDGVLAMAATVTRFMTSNITGRNVVWSIMSNMPRDIVTALVFSKNHNPAEVIGGMVRNYANFIAGDKANNQYFDEFIAMGGGQVTSWNADIDNSSKIQRQMGWLTDYSAADTNILQKGGRKVKGVGVGFISALDQISSAIESGPRFAEYESLRKQDVSPQDAFYAAMDVTTNFARHGRMSQGVNYLVPFFNASVQGIDKFSRWIRATDVEGTKAERQQASIGRMLVWAGASMLLAAMIYGFNNRDDENKKYYQMLSNYTKNNYFCLSLGDGRFRTIPKPREIAVLESFFESAMEYAHGGNKEAFNEFYDYATEQLIPPAVSPILKADVNGLLSDFGLFGALAAINGNRDFLGNPIESRSFDSSNTPINDRMNSNTSVMAKWIADIIAASDIIPEKAKENASPLKIDYFLKQVLGGFWKTPANIFPIGDEYKEENKAAFIAAGLGRAIGGNYTKDALYSNDLINWIYDYKTEQARKGNEGTGDFDAEFNAKLAERYTDFYGRFYGLTKNASNSDEVRQLRKSVLDTMIQFKKQAENDMFPAYIEELRKVAQDQSEKKIGDLMPMVFEKEIKDANGEKHLLTGAQYYELQTRYNSYYAEGVQAILANDELSANEKAAGIDRMKDDISARAKREILEMIGAPTSAVTTAASGKESTTYIDKWGPFYSKMSTGEMAGLRVSVSAQTSWYTPEHNAITNSQSVKMAKVIVEYGLNLSEDDTVALMDAFGVSKTVIESYKNGGLNDMYSALEEQYNNSWADYNENNGG